MVLYGGRRRVATAAAGVLAAGLAYHVVFGHNGLTAFRQKSQASTSLDHQIGELTRENDVLSGHVERLKSDAGAIEQQAREGLHYTRPGEVIYTVNGLVKPAADAPAPP